MTKDYNHVSTRIKDIILYHTMSQNMLHTLEIIGDTETFLLLQIQNTGFVQNLYAYNCFERPQ